MPRPRVRSAQRIKLPLGLTVAEVIDILRRDFMFNPGPHIPLVPIEQLTGNFALWDMSCTNPQRAVGFLGDLLTGFNVGERELFCWLVGVRLAQRCVVDTNELGSVLDALYLAIYQSLLQHLLPKRVSVDRCETELMAIAQSILGGYLNGVENVVQYPQLWPPCRMGVLPGWRKMVEQALRRDEPICLRNSWECGL